MPTSADDTRVALLQEDPDLAERVPADRRPYAIAGCTARLVNLRTGIWDFPAGEAPEPSAMGYLILEGNLLRTLSVGTRRAAVVHGPGEVIQPWTRTPHWNDLHCASLRALSPLRLALLDRRFVTQMANFPELAGALTERLVQSHRELVLNLAIASYTRVDSRLHLTLWQMAAKWGRMRPDGVLLPIKLTHTVMAALVGCRRPTITTALADLSQRGVVRRVDTGWLLIGEPPQELTSG